LLLLADLREIFERLARPRLPSAVLIEELIQLEDRPWPEWRGRGLSPTNLAYLLQPFGVKPKVRRLDRGTARGYELAELTPVFATYLPRPARGVTPVTADPEPADVTPVTPSAGMERIRVEDDELVEKGLML
jgi:hypothetical protein